MEARWRGSQRMSQTVVAEWGTKVRAAVRRMPIRDRNPGSFVARIGGDGVMLSPLCFPF
jgi:hypothetical protein